MTLPKGVLGLKGGDGVDLVGAADGGGRGFGEAEVFDLAGLDELGHGADGVFDGGVGIDAMLVVEVDVVEAKALEAGVAGLVDVLRLAPSRETTAPCVPSFAGFNAHDWMR